MTSSWQASLHSQFGAAIDMLEHAIRACPDRAWNLPGDEPPFWYLAYHTIFWLDLYLSPTAAGFRPPPPFTLSELNDAAPRPGAYPPEQLLAYLAHARAKAGRVLAALTDTGAAAPSPFSWFTGTVGELHFYNLRHVQHGAGQLNLRLRLAGAEAPPWVSRHPGTT